GGCALPVNLRAKTEDLVARVVVVGEVAGHLLNAHVLQPGRIQNVPSGGSTTDGHLHFGSLGKGGLHPHLSPEGQQQRRRDVYEINRIEEHHLYPLIDFAVPRHIEGISFIYAECYRGVRAATRRVTQYKYGTFRASGA